jgi:uncharacterized protein CbrC (UPF0167 family)
MRLAGVDKTSMSMMMRLRLLLLFSSLKSMPAESGSPDYRYVVRDEILSGYRRDGLKCSYCRAFTMAYSFVILCDPDCEAVESVCDRCLKQETSNGAFKMNRGDVAELLVSLASIHPEFCSSELEKIASLRTELIERSTPPILGILGPNWPIHCGDYCSFHGDMYISDLRDPSQSQLKPVLESIECMSQDELLQRFRKYLVYSRLQKVIRLAIHTFHCRWCEKQIPVWDFQCQY